MSPSFSIPSDAIYYRYYNGGFRFGFCIIISLLSFLIVPGGLETPIRVNRHWFADVATERTVYKCIGAGLCVQQTGQFDFVRYVLRRHNKNRNPGPYWPTLHLAMGPYRPPLFISWLTSKRCDGLYLHVHTYIYCVDYIDICKRDSRYGYTVSLGQRK